MKDQMGNAIHLGNVVAFAIDGAAGPEVASGVVISGGAVIGGLANVKIKNDFGYFEKLTSEVILIKGGVV